MIMALTGNNGPSTADATVPMGLLGINGHADGIRPYVPGHVVKKVELKLRQDQHCISHTCAAHIRLRRQDNIPRILGQRPVMRVVNQHGITGHGERGNIAERIHLGGLRIRDKDHVALFHHCIAIVGGIKSNAFCDGGFGEIPGRNGHMAILPVDVHHFEINHLDIFFLDTSDDVLCCCGHIFYLTSFQAVRHTQLPPR